MISTSIWINECLVTGNNYVINGVIIKKEDKRDTQSIGFDTELNVREKGNRLWVLVQKIWLCCKISVNIHN
jgi:hypothetical protein